MFRRNYDPNNKRTHLEEVKERTSVQTGLLVDGVDGGRLLAADCRETDVEVELETLGEVVLSLDRGLDPVAGRPPMKPSLRDPQCCYA